MPLQTGFTINAQTHAWTLCITYSNQNAISLHVWLHQPPYEALKIKEYKNLLSNAVTLHRQCGYK